MPVTLDHKGKAQQKRRSGCSLGTCNTQCTYWTRFLLPSFGNLCLLPIRLPVQRAQLPTPPSAGLILQPGTAASAPRQRGQATAGAGVLPPGQTPRGLLATWTITANQKDGPPPSICCLRHVHPTDRRRDRDVRRHNRAGRGQSWKRREVPRPPASPQWSLCFCSIRFCSPPWITSSLGIATGTSMLYSSCSVEIPHVGAERLQIITEAQLSAINSRLACSELAKWAQLILHRDVREHWGRLWQAGGRSCLCQGPLHFSPVRWLSYYVSSLAWKLRLFCASGSTPN